MVLTLVASHPVLNEWVDGNSCQEQQAYYQWHHDTHWNHEVKDCNVPITWSQTQRAIKPTDVPVWLGSSRNRGWVIGSVVPNWVHGEQRRNSGDDTKHQEEESSGLRNVNRHQRVSNYVLVGATRTGVVGVLVNNEHH